METAYRMVWKPQYKKLEIIRNHNIRRALYGGQNKKMYKLFFFFFLIEWKVSYKDWQKKLNKNYTKWLLSNKK